MERIKCPVRHGIYCSALRDDGTCCEYIPAGPRGFSVIYRNPGHWDITTAGLRAFRIRGDEGAGKVMVSDERNRNQYPEGPSGWLLFKTVSAALLWCADELMNNP